MFIKTVSTTSGINPIKFDETGGVFYWILNTGLSTVYASTKATFTAGDDGEKADRWPLSIIRIPPLAEFSLGLQLAC